MPRSTLQQQLARKTGVSLLIGTTLWILLLMHGASLVRSQASDIGYTVAIGPCTLHTLTRHAVEGGFRTTITFESGLLWLLLLCVLAGIVAGLATYMQKSKKIRD